MPFLLLIGVLLIICGFSILKKHSIAGFFMICFGVAIMNLIADVY